MPLVVALLSVLVWLLVAPPPVVEEPVELCETIVCNDFCAASSTARFHDALEPSSPLTVPETLASALAPKPENPADAFVSTEKPTDAVTLPPTSLVDFWEFVSVSCTCWFVVDP